MKVHLANFSWQDDKLKKLCHNLLKCWFTVILAGLNLEDSPPKWLHGLNNSHNRQRFRYLMSYESLWLPHFKVYFEELSVLLRTLVNDCLYFGGKR